MQFIVNVWKVQKDRNILIEFAQGGGGSRFTVIFRNFNVRLRGNNACNEYVLLGYVSIRCCLLHCLLACLLVRLFGCLFGVYNPLENFSLARSRRNHVHG